MTSLFGLLGLGFDLSLHTRKGILRGGQFPRRAGTKVFADEAAIDALRSRVVTSLSSSLLPAHAVSRF